jgi:hypothetical protein
VPVPLPEFKIHVINKPPIPHTILSDINITVPNSIDINLSYSDPEGYLLTNMTLLGPRLNYVNLLQGKVFQVHSTFQTPNTYYTDLQLELTDGVNIVSLPKFSIFINNTPAYFNDTFKNFSILVGSYTKYVMPSFFDPENNPRLLFKNATPIPSFVTFNYTTLEFQFMPTIDDGNTHSEIVLQLFDGVYTTNGSFHIYVGIPIIPLIKGSGTSENGVLKYSEILKVEVGEVKSYLIDELK